HRMPPIGSNLLDKEAIELIREWIQTDLRGRISYEEWVLTQFGDATARDSAPLQDADGDKAPNLLEYLTGTDPEDSDDFWKSSIHYREGRPVVSFPRIPDLAFEVQWNDQPDKVDNWKALDVPDNRRFIASSPEEAVVRDSTTDGIKARYYRIRVIQP
ncbi:MAG TPA: hypothetical protein EYG38_11625, partial [Verrucomicrobia bacterium]|nr:hypothetical protein [Verrucomicrobiota bacterium]